MKISKIFLTILILGNVNIASAQVSGFGTLGSGSINITSGVHYTDNIRTKVTGISTTGSSATLTVPTGSGGSSIHGFTNGMMVLLIQMKVNSGGAGVIGTHQNAYVTANTSSTITISTVSTSNIHSTYSAHLTDDRLQLIKIPEFYDLNLSGGVITCHSWDNNAGTGGILCMVISNDLNITGGAISVAGKGYTSVESGAVYATGGVAGSAASVYVAGSTLAPTLANYDGGSGCSIMGVVNVGDVGGLQGSAPASAGTNSGKPGSPVYPASNYYTKLVMGNPGYYVNGYGGGLGSRGGGYGGDGGPVPGCSTTGSAGTAGNNGGPGGGAGWGGNGGGAIVIKAFNVDISTSPSGQPIFYAGGQRGQDGGNASNGGQGGIGGTGGAGCTGYCQQGGWGADGDIGAGGIGGAAGNGGSAGYVWIACQGVYTTNAGAKSDNFNITGGTAGAGGKGGWGGGNRTENTQGLPNTCTTVECPNGSGGSHNNNGGSGCRTICDVDAAMCYLAIHTTSASVGSGLHRFYDVSTEIGTYDLLGNQELLVSADGCTKWMANWRDGSPKAPGFMFNHLMSAGGGGTNSTVGGPVDYSKTEINGCAGGISYPINIIFKDASENALLTYHREDATAVAYIEEMESIPTARIYSNDCKNVEDGDGGDTKNDDGDDGEDGEDGDYDEENPDPESNVYIDESALWKKSKTNKLNLLTNPLKLSIYPNPANKGIWVQMIAAQNESAVISILDITGKQIFTTNEHVSIGENKFYVNTKSINKGLYIVEVRTATNTSRLNLIID